MLRKRFLVLTVLLTLFISGTSLAAAGQKVATSQTKLPYLKPVTAKIKSFDNFGNGVLSVTVSEFMSAGYRAGDIFMIEVPNAGAFYVPFVNSIKENGIYGFSLVADSFTAPYLALAISDVNFAKIFKANLGAPIKITRARYQAHTPDMTVLAMTRKLHTSKEPANFREITQGNAKQGLLYRSASPIDFKKIPSMYEAADRLAREARISTVINLANSQAEMQSLVKQSSNSGSYYKTLFARGQVFAAKTRGFHYDKQDVAILADAFRFMLKHDGPYLIHDTFGEDKAGFFCLLLEGLCGASKSEVIEDYMKSYVNMLNIVPGSIEYNTIKQYTVARLLIALSVPSIMYSPQSVDWRSGTGDNIPLDQAVRSYLHNIVGLSETEIKLLQTRFSTKTSKTQNAQTKTQSNAALKQEMKKTVKQKVKNNLESFKNWWRK